MSKHKVDISMSGMSHYVDGQLHGTSGFTQLPDGLHLERRVGAPTNKTKKFVRKEGIGRSIEWTSNPDSHRAQADQHRAAPPPGHPRGRGPGPRRGEQQREQQREQPGQAFDVSEGDSEDGEAQSQAHPRRDDAVTVNYQDHNRHRRRHNNSDRAIRAMGSFPVAWNEERPPRLEFDELLQWEHDHRSARYQDHTGYDGPVPVAWKEERPHGLKFDELLQWERDHGSARYQDHNTYDGPGRAGRAMNFNPGNSYSRDLRPWLGDLEDCQWEPNHRSWR